MKTSEFVTDEHKTSEDITRHIQAFAKELELGNEQDLEFGARFYRVCGGKIFRDFIYNTSAVFRADHLFYKKVGVYNGFPQRKVKKKSSTPFFHFLLPSGP